MATATPTSTALTDAADLCSSFSTPPPPRSAPADVIGARRSPPARRRTSSRQESRFLHEHDVPRLLARHPGFVILSAQRGLVERPLLEKTLPLGGLANLLEQVDIELNLIGRHAAGHENPAQHQVLDVEASFPASGNIVPGHRLGDLRLVRHAFGFEE